MSSRRRMMAAVADLSFAYFSTIELIAFSYAISGCSFSTFEIQIDRKPRQRFAETTEETDSRHVMSFPFTEPCGSTSFGESRTTRATVSWPKNSRTFWIPSFFSLQACGDGELLLPCGSP